MNSTSPKRTPDSELNLAARHPDRQTFLNINETESERVRNCHKCFLEVAYGEDPLQRMDIFPSPVVNSPILVFIHGGYWRSLDKKSYSFVAEAFVAKNVTVAVINYRLIPTVDMLRLLQDVKDSVEFIQKHATDYNGNPSQIALSGHSAGGHLALMTYLMNPSMQPSVPAICSLSGIFDLNAIRHSYLSDDTLQLSPDDVGQFSASNKDLAAVKCSTLIAVGGGETTFFVEESKKIAKARPSFRYHEYDNLNHYQIVHLLGAFQQDDVMIPFLLEKLLGSKES
ncbi:Kynurenine formamidase [Seminavis robusta]|uniref:Kynurenine formamidase n=1 Tax=Seminavis robusta TaxID=568900 RepID=A0A9N8ERF8_9STRA|nr:Kynurenine formamidase [Seminavis robusta]|eukprot:Sro1478_g276040.1 Kynurenine formamidase (283) ;mRNA; r:15221-16069